MIKPKFLYHASQNRDIEILEPKKDKVRDPKEGPVVFATPYLDYASCFLASTDDSWVKISRFSTDHSWKTKTSWNVIIGDKNRFTENDHGGVIYVLPSKTFYCDPEKGTRESEWISKEPVRPIKKIVYKSGLTAMLENGVNVFFVSKSIFDRITASSDHGWSIISKLKPLEKINKP
jgi:hypothetical protein